jgi:putative spermidine/putrescine transport system permease protein
MPPEPNAGLRVRWELLLLPACLVSFGLLVVTQLLFLRLSLFRDLRFGRLGSSAGLGNYIAVFTDPFYLSALWLTIEVSAIVAVVALLLAYPMAYLLARMHPSWAARLLALAVTVSFVTIIIKVLGLIIIFGADGALNRSLLALGLVDRPISPYGSVGGVVLGQLLYTLPFMLLTLFSVIRTIPRSLEDAAEIHGASRWRTMLRVVVPLSLPGVIGGTLVVFNLSMGSFTSAALLGGGRVLTLPVLIQQTAMVQIKYGLSGTLAAVLLVATLLINLVSVLAISRRGPTRTRVA